MAVKKRRRSQTEDHWEFCKANVGATFGPLFLLIGFRLIWEQHSIEGLGCLWLGFRMTRYGCLYFCNLLREIFRVAKKIWNERRDRDK